MKKISLIFFIFLLSCSTTKISNNQIEFSENMSFKDFIIKLEEYAINKPFPNIDE